MAKVVCPYCFEEFERKNVMFRCPNSQCKVDSDELLEQFWGVGMPATPAFSVQGGFLSFLSDKMPESGTCPECSRKSFNTICPQCHNPIPRSMVEKKGFIISIIGARSSGKTNYITVLIDQLQRRLHHLGKIGFRATAVGNSTDDYTTNRYMNDFYNVLYRSGQCPPQTQIGDRKSKVPLIYELTQQNEQPINLVFYDTAGENFNDIANIENNVKFLEHSDAIIYLLDTFAIPAVHEKLGIRDEIEMKFDTILSNVIDYFREHHPDKAKAFFSKPMALVFSKIDAILQNEDIFPSVSIPEFNHDSSFLDGTGFDIGEVNRISDALRTALESASAWNEPNFVNTITTAFNKMKEPKFLGISALGKSPSLDNQIRDIRPYRVLDPLAWILYELKYKMKLSNK